MPKACTSAEATRVLERADVLPRDPLPPELEAAAVAMRKSIWWFNIPPTKYKDKMLPRGAWQCLGSWVGTGDATTGEFHAR